MTDPAFAADTKGEQGVLKYGERRVNTDTPYQADDADFSYDSMPRNAHMRGPGKKTDEPDFLKRNAPSDFYDLSGGVYADESVVNDDYSQRPAAGGYYRPEDDMPYEVNDDTAFDYSVDSTGKERFWPASAVKLTAAVLALYKLKELLFVEWSDNDKYWCFSRQWIDVHSFA